MRFYIFAAIILLSFSTVLSSGAGHRDRDGEDDEDNYSDSDEGDWGEGSGRRAFCEYLRWDCRRSIGRRAVACLSILRQNCEHVPLGHIEEPLKIVKAFSSSSGSAAHVKGKGGQKHYGVLLTNKERYATVTT